MNKEIYKIWSPKESIWSSWVRPVPFINLNNDITEYIDYNLPNISYITKNDYNMAIIVDLPGIESIKEGLSLALLGYIPIPVYNGVIEQKNSHAVTNNKVIAPFLIYGSNILKKIKFKDNPPVFLLDSNRLNRKKRNSNLFDNSWDIYHQDLPSSKFFLSHDINKILIVSDKVNKDINLILYEFPKDKFDFYLTDGYIIKKIKLRKPNKKERENA